MPKWFLCHHQIFVSHNLGGQKNSFRCLSNRGARPPGGSHCRYRGARGGIQNYFVSRPFSRTIETFPVYESTQAAVASDPSMNPSWAWTEEPCQACKHVHENICSWKARRSHLYWCVICFISMRWFTPALIFVLHRLHICFKNICSVKLLIYWFVFHKLHLWKDVERKTG